MPPEGSDQPASATTYSDHLNLAVSVSRRELARAAMLQAVKFGTRLVSPRAVTGVTREPDGFRVRLDDEIDVLSSAVVVASLVLYRRLDLPGLADLEGQGVYYAATTCATRCPTT